MLVGIPGLGWLNLGWHLVMDGALLVVVLPLRLNTGSGGFVGQHVCVVSRNGSRDLKDRKEAEREAAVTRDQSLFCRK